MKLFGFTCTFNEEDMIPYVMPYIERLGYDKFIVYDNCSTDKTVEMLSKYSFIEIRTYDTNGKFDDFKRAQLQYESICESFQYTLNNENEDVWITFTDFDEVLFLNSYYPLKTILNMYCGDDEYYYDKKMVNIFLPKNYNYNNFKKGTLIHTEYGVTCSFWNDGGNKTILLKVNNIQGLIETYPGNHRLHIQYNTNNINSIRFNDLYSFHLKYILGKEKIIKKGYINNERRNNDGLYDILINDENFYDSMYAESIPFGYYIFNKHLNEEDFFKTCKKNGFNIIKNEEV